MKNSSNCRYKFKTGHKQNSETIIFDPSGMVWKQLSFFCLPLWPLCWTHFWVWYFGRLENDSIDVLLSAHRSTQDKPDYQVSRDSRRENLRYELSQSEQKCPVLGTFSAGPMLDLVFELTGETVAGLLWHCLCSIYAIFRARFLSLASTMLTDR